MGTPLCDVTVTLKRQRKIVNIFFLKQDTFFYKKMYVWHFYQKMHTELHSGLHYTFLDYMGLDVTKPVFGVSDKARLKPVSSTTGSS